MFVVVRAGAVILLSEILHMKNCFVIFLFTIMDATFGMDLVQGATFKLSAMIAMPKHNE